MYMSATSTLTRKLGLWATISIVAGSVIGSSIFMNPSTMAAQLGSPMIMLGVWIFGGAISMIGASINAEIGAMMPVTGGQYVFFKKMYYESKLLSGIFFIMFNFSAYCSLSSDFSGGKQVKIVFKALKNDEILPAKMY